MGLRQTFCELLAWGTSNWVVLPPGLSPGVLGSGMAPGAWDLPESRQLRAGAPEFVPLGIPIPELSPFGGAKEPLRRSRSEDRVAHDAKHMRDIWAGHRGRAPERRRTRI